MNYIPLVIIGLVMIGFMVVLGVDASGLKREDVVIEEYYVNNLKIRVFFGREDEMVYADTRDYDEKAEVGITLIVRQKASSEIERKAEGQWLDAGPAIVRVIAGTDEVVSWTYIRE